MDEVVTNEVSTRAQKLLRLAESKEPSAFSVQSSEMAGFGELRDSVLEAFVVIGFDSFYFEKQKS